MSLPTYAKFYNDKDELIASHFVNVGWFISTDAIEEAVLRFPWVRDAVKIQLYHYTFDSSISIFPLDSKREKWDEVRSIVRKVVEEANERFEQESTLPKESS